jgi:hypothetical protein
MADFLQQEGILILTGMTITLLTGLIYSTSSRGFKAGGKYRKRHEAVVIYLSAMIILGAMTPVIQFGTAMVVEVVPIISIFGLFIIGASFILHRSIKKWKHTSVQSLLVYFFGAFLIVFGYLVASIV